MDDANACLLPPSRLRQRLDRIQTLAARHLLDERLDGSTWRLGYAAMAEAELRALVDAEKDCCGFLDFQLRRDGRRIELAITAPADQDAFTRHLLDHFRGREQPAMEGCGRAACGCA